MTEQKELGYELNNVIWRNIPGYQDLWNKTDFDTKEKIINELGRLVLEKLQLDESIKKDILHVCLWYQGRDVDACERVEKFASTEPIPERKVCPVCFGLGYEDGGGDYANETCLVCGGTGYIYILAKKVHKRL